MGSAARSIAGLWWFMVALGAVAFAIFIVGLVVGARRDPVESSRGTVDDGPPPVDNVVQPSTKRWLVGGGLVLPALSVVAVVVATVVVMNTVAAQGAQADLEVDVTGHQWWWEFDYPDQGVTATDELHIPAGQTVRLRLHSDNVIHSFWVPSLAGKMDLIPGRTNELVIDAFEPGRYEGYCAEFCGLNHAMMRFVVVAHEPDEFQEWVAAQQQDSSGGLDSSSEGSTTTTQIEEGS